jgi:hypothetical protein
MMMERLLTMKSVRTLMTSHNTEGSITKRDDETLLVIVVGAALVCIIIGGVVLVQRRKQKMGVNGTMPFPLKQPTSPSNQLKMQSHGTAQCAC